MDCKKEISRIFAVSRVFALISIVCAHINFEGAVGRVYDVLGSIGVIAFLFVSLSNNSFTIYLIHMILIGIMDRVFGLNIITMALSSLLVIAVAQILLELCRLVIRLIKAEKIFGPLLGFRNRKI